MITGGLAFSIIWTAIEKLLYPQWTEQVLQTHKHLELGINSQLFTTLAAFTEFTLAFYLATGRGLLRIGALALGLVFVTAMPEFGVRDLIGHIPIVTVIAIPFLVGASALQRFWRLPRRGIAFNAAVTCALYVVTLTVFLSMYYGVQWIEYRAAV
jgi:small-conductance mechanosensitive channel